jgi:hypothetical protein
VSSSRKLPGVAGARRILDGEEAVALDGEIELVAGLLEIAGPVVGEGADLHHR